jgi:hypothetical protein
MACSAQQITTKRIREYPMKRAIRLAIALVLVGTISGTAQGPAQKQTRPERAVPSQQAQRLKEPDRTTRAEKSRGGTDPNVKQDRQAATEEDKVTLPAPPHKAEAREGERSRQVGMCTVIVDNWTGYAIDLFVDGTYRGTVSGYGEGYTYAISGATQLYARSAGGSLYWGPYTVSCISSYVWRLDD